MNQNLDSINGQCNSHLPPEYVKIDLFPGQTFPMIRSNLMPNYRLNSSCATPFTPLKYTLVGSSVSKDSQQRANGIQRDQNNAFPRNQMAPDVQSHELLSSTGRQAREIPIEIIPYEGKRFVRNDSNAPSMFLGEGLVSSSKVPSITRPQNCMENNRTIVRAPRTCQPLIRNLRSPVATFDSPCGTRTFPVHSTPKAVFAVQPGQLHRLAQGTPVRHPLKLVSVPASHSSESSCPSNAIKNVRDQLERKRKVVSSPTVPFPSCSGTSFVKVPRTKSIAPANGVNAGRQSLSIKKQNTSSGEIVCLSSDEDSDQEELDQTVDRITIQKVESIGPSENVSTSEGDKVQSCIENKGGDEKEDGTKLDEGMDSTTSVEEKDDQSKFSPPLRETDFPYLSKNSIDPNCYTPVDVELQLMSIYCNKNSVVPHNADLLTTFSASKIILPPSMLSIGPEPSNQNRLPKQIKYENIKAIRFAKMTNFNAVLLSLENSCSSELPTNGSKSGARALAAILLVLKTPLPEDSLNKLMIIFETLNYDRHDTKFFKEDSNSVISHYQKIDPNSFDSKAISTVSSSKQKTTTNNNSSVEKAASSFSALPQVLYTYKMLKSAISITTEDVKCLRPDEFLNDTIIDFFCNYLLDKYLSPEQRETVHLFSSFFYKTYTQVNSTSRSSLTTSADAASKNNNQIKYRRHEKVKNWTKNVDLFKKDFIFIPVNEDWHWFLVVICYPNRVVNSNSLQTLMVYGKTQGSSQPFSTEKFLEEKQPLVLVLNSLITGSKVNLFKLLKDYLQCEHEAKNTAAGGFNRNMFLHSSPTVPQQTNSFDCGLYLLKYLEKFINDFINVKEHKKVDWEKWFETSETATMRDEFKQTISDLHTESTRSGKQSKCTPKEVRSTAV